MIEGSELLLVFGSSADPVHEGHVALVVEAVRALTRRGYRVREVMLMPVFRHHTINDSIKSSLPLTYENRYAFSLFARDDIARELGDLVRGVSVSRLEADLVSKGNQPNFTAETMRALRNTTPAEIELAFLVGADSFSGDEPGFADWYNVEDLLRTTTVVISPRKGVELNEDYLAALEATGARIIYLEELSVPDVSSSELRSRLISGEDTQELVSEGLINQDVADYIVQHNVIASWRRLSGLDKVQVVTDALNPDDNLQTRVGKLLYQKKLTLSLAESCTGGLLGHLVTNVPGASEYFMGGVVAYAYQAKVNQLGVSWETLRAHGAVSGETVLEMARGVRRSFATDIGISLSCIAGPGGQTAEKPVGTAWCGLSSERGEWSYQFLLGGSRLEVKERLVHKALEVLLAYLEDALPSALDFAWPPRK